MDRPAAMTPIQSMRESRAGEAGARGHSSGFPIGRVAVDGEMENEGVQTEKREEHQLDAECRAFVIAHGFGEKHQQTGERHHGEAGEGEGDDAGDDILDGFFAQSEAEEAQIDEENRAGDEHDAEGVNGIDDGESRARTGA